MNRNGKKLTPEEAARYTVEDYQKVGGYPREADNVAIGAEQGESVTVGKYSAVAGLEGSKLSARGDSIIAGFNCKAKGGLGTLIVIAERDLRYGDIKGYAVGIVDNKRLMQDTWYKVKDGEFVRVSDEEADNV